MCNVRTPAWFRRALGQEAESYWSAWQRAVANAGRAQPAPGGCLNSTGNRPPYAAPSAARPGVTRG